MDNNGSGRWNPTNGHYKPLRTPKSSNAPLSVNAPEFVPKSAIVQQQQPMHIPPHQVQMPHHHPHQQQQHYVGYAHHDAQNHHPINSGASGGGGGGGGGDGMKPSVQDRMRNHQNPGVSYNNHHKESHMPHHHQSYGGGGGGYYDQNVTHHPLLNASSSGMNADGNSLTSRIRNIQINPQQNYQEPVEDNKQVSETETMALNYLSEVMTKLYDNPGLFETYQKKVREIFSELKVNHFVMSNAVEMIFEQSINEQNFRYMGARLCNLLDNLDESPESIFRNLMRMKMEFQQMELAGFMQNEQRKVRGATLFLAELYMQLRKPHDKTRNIEIAIWIVNAINLLLSKQGPENVKCVCQTLKLCGYELDMDRPDEVASILMILTNIENTLDVSTGRLVRSVLDLKGKRWGREELVAQPVLHEVSHQVYNDSPVFYGPDGQILTEEENSFLETNTPSLANFDYDDFDDEDPDELVDDENGIDLEIKLAFKDFIQNAKNTKY